MNVDWQIRPEQSKIWPLGLLQLIFTLIGWGAGLVVFLFTKGTSIPMWFRNILIGFIVCTFGVTLVLGIIPASRLLKSWVDSARKKRQQQRSLMKLAEVVQESHHFFAPHQTNSLLNYVNSLSHTLVQDQALHPHIKSLSERLQILSDWHGTLFTLAESGFKQKILFHKIVSDITRFYYDLANIVRELANTKLPEEGPISAHDDQRRMIKDKYNQHIERLEQVLEAINKVNPEFQTGNFHRF